jgi:hypothetical protein
LHPRAAAKKSGATVDHFLKKIDQQMGVVIVGFAAFRDEGGRLCRFEYDSISLWFAYLLKGLQYRFSTEDSRPSAFSKVHSKEIEEFSKKWGKYVAQKGKLH